MYGGLGAQAAGLGGSGSAVRGRRCVLGSVAWGNWGGYAVEVLCLPDVPVQCRPIRVGEEGLGQEREGSVGSSSVVCNWQMCGDVGSVELGGSPVWSGHIYIGSIHSRGDWR